MGKINILNDAGTNKLSLEFNGTSDSTLNAESIANTFSENGLTIPSLTSDPSNPVNGQMYYNITTNSMKLYNGTTWKDLGAEKGTQGNPAESASELKALGKPSGYYWIKTLTAESYTYCDMSTIDGGGWTLIGKSGGGSWHGPGTWLRSDVGDMSNKLTPGSNTYACIDARRVAGDVATEVMLSNFAMDRWVKAPINTNATSETIFNHTVGQSIVDASISQEVTSTAWNGGSTVCYVNPYMIMRLAGHGGSTPAFTKNEAGNTDINDYSMAVACMTTGAYGWTGVGNGRDAPYDTGDYGWPNSSYGTAHFYGLVWVR